MSYNKPKDALADYVPVAERIEKFHAKYPEGRILTSIVEHDTETGFILMRAEVYRHADDVTPAATGHAYEIKGESYVNKTSYVENAETGSVGRALAILGFEVKRGLASREEMEKVNRLNAGQGAGRQEVGRGNAERPERRREVDAPVTEVSNIEAIDAAPRIAPARVEPPHAVHTEFAKRDVAAVSHVSVTADEPVAADNVAAHPSLGSPSRATNRLPNLRPVTENDAPASEEQKAMILGLLERLRPRDRRAQRALLLEKTGKGSREELNAQEAQNLIADLRG